MLKGNSDSGNPTTLALFRFYGLLYDLWGSIYYGHQSVFLQPMAERSHLFDELRKILVYLGNAFDISWEVFLGIRMDYYRVTNLARKYEESSSNLIGQAQLASEHQSELRYLRSRAREYQYAVTLV